MSVPYLFGCAAFGLMAAQGLFLALAPQRFAKWELWKARLIGARPADPGQGTFLLYRAFGVAICFFSLFIFFKFVSE